MYKWSVFIFLISNIKIRRVLKVNKEIKSFVDELELIFLDFKKESVKNVW